MFSSTTVGAVCVISGDEPLTTSRLEMIAPVFDACLETGSAHIVLNLERVPLFDSQGLEWLIHAAGRCSVAGGQLQIAAANPLCQDILRITGIGDRFEAFTDVRAAVRSFAR